MFENILKFGQTCLNNSDLSNLIKIFFYFLSKKYINYIKSTKSTNTFKRLSVSPKIFCLFRIAFIL